MEHYEGRYRGLVDTFVIDQEDAAEAAAIRTTGTDITVLDTVMRSHADRQRLAEEIMAPYLPDRRHGCVLGRTTMRATDDH